MNLLVIKTLTDGTIARSLVNYPSENEALSALYYELWYATSNTDVFSAVAELISDDGRVAKCERYFAPVSNPVPVTESEAESDE